MTQSATLHWLSAPLAVANQEMRQLAEQRQAQLTKPPGSLGRLEEFAIRLAALQNTQQPGVDRVHIAIFAADHGVAAEGVSAFPQSVTAEMIKNFSRGGAAINVLARALNASLEIINLGTVHDTQALADVRHCHLGPGTANFVHQPAMTWEQLSQAFQAGFDSIERAQQTGQQLFIGGEMGIGNTTSATALACLLLNEQPVRLTGRGTGLDAQGIAHKITVIARALSLHRPQADSPLDTLRRVGGFEIAALAGAYIHGAQLGLPLLIDGFISTVAALAAEHIVPGCKDWFIFSHQSSEQGHALVLEALNADPLIDLQMRLGEGSGAAVTLSLLRMACSLHNEMATFSEAQVSQQSEHP
ncbi:nicotinate-nucleotide--dimethylbenzimidazole phosphoribosyltransferase [Nitrosomonas oligotropha]|uniref:nicotinate-nucleotide--dimethylbenzimidazole phosphoribosyltransferase n=1 Tax=Nitrosomonas oligotropha TaxID=42354 RepID=UPI00137076DA|nr:nicotinate-nucleotide--dimethylbenzimidazole phosphoribosyltransferase [Nitrosomonas oligotropha]MXS82570.1 nicotinate-nucleotide--dimethylbenzimidazole phosphoribosyltransferase [Nitrosomonas oligotropha]